MTDYKCDSCNQTWPTYASYYNHNCPPKLAIAAKVEIVMDLHGGQEIYDEYGEPTGELAAQVISTEEAKKLLGFEW